MTGLTNPGRTAVVSFRCSRITRRRHSFESASVRVRLSERRALRFRRREGVSPLHNRRTGASSHAHASKERRERNRSIVGLDWTFDNLGLLSEKVRHMLLHIVCG